MILAIPIRRRSERPAHTRGPRKLGPLAFLGLEIFGPRCVAGSTGTQYGKPVQVAHECKPIHVALRIASPWVIRAESPTAPTPCIPISRVKTATPIYPFGEKSALAFYPHGDCERPVPRAGSTTPIRMFFDSDRVTLEESGRVIRAESPLTEILRCDGEGAAMS